MITIALKPYMIRIVVAMAFFAAETQADDVFVSPSGKDSNSGTQQEPFATLAKAKLAVRQLRASRPETTETHRIVLRGGTYRLSKTVVFDRSDDSTKENPTIITAAAGERPIISGSTPLPGVWKRASMDLSGLPEIAKGKVWEAELPEGWPLFHCLFYGDKMLPRATTKGFNPIKYKSSSEQPVLPNTTMLLPAEMTRSISNFAEAELRVIPQHPWVMNILPIDRVDRDSGLLTTRVPATYDIQPVSPGVATFKSTAWIENVLEALDEPGEWVFDKLQRKIYLWPLDNRQPGVEVVVPRLSELIRIEGQSDYEGPEDVPVKGIVFDGITFTQADRWPWEAKKTGIGLQHDWEMFDRPTALLRFRGTEDCRVENCSFVNSGGTGLRVDLHGQRNFIKRCDFSYLGGAGVVFAGYGLGSKDVNHHNEVSDCRIHHVGQLLWHAPGVFAWQSGHNRIEHNELYALPYAAIVVSGRSVMDRKGNMESSRLVRWAEVKSVLGSNPSTWANREPLMHSRENLVSKNDIYDVMKRLSDGNAIYVSGCGANNRIENNFIHDIDSVNINAAIRCDDDQHKTFIERNVVTRTTGEGVVFKGANTVRNNLFYDIRTETSYGLPCVRKRGYIVLSGTTVDGSIVEKNIFVSATAQQPVLHENVKTKAFLRTCQVDHNLYFNTAQPNWAVAHLTTQQAFGIEKHSREADPLFIAPAKDDFRFSPVSPAAELGIEAVSVTEVGRRK